MKKRKLTEKELKELGSAAVKLIDDGSEYAHDHLWSNLKAMVSKFREGKGEKPAITIGYMVRIKRRSKHSEWPEYAGRYCITTDMSGSSDFSVLLLPAGHKESDPLELCSEVIGEEVAWIDEDELTFINSNVRDNMEFYSKCKAEEEYTCPDCGVWNKDRNKCIDSECENELQCLECGCIW